MRKIVAACFISFVSILAAPSLQAAPADATGNQQGVNTSSGAPLSLRYRDLSGTGAGPFIPETMCVDGSGNACVFGGGSVNTTGGTLANRSAAIAAVDTAQQLAAANSSRRGFLIQNNTADACWWNTLAVAVETQPSIKLASGALFETPSTMYAPGAISIICVATGDVSAREW